MLLKLLTIFVVVALAACRSANNDDIDKVVDEIFSDAPTKGSGVTSNFDVLDPSVIEAIFGKDPIPKREMQGENGGSGSDAVSEKHENCEMPDGKQGVCVPYYLCESTGDVDVDGVGFIDIRGIKDSCTTWIDKCCDSTKMKSS